VGRNNAHQNSTLSASRANLSSAVRRRTPPYHRVGGTLVSLYPARHRRHHTKMHESVEHCGAPWQTRAPRACPGAVRSRPGPSDRGLSTSVTRTSVFQRNQSGRRALRRSPSVGNCRIPSLAGLETSRDRLTQTVCTTQVPSSAPITYMGRL